MLKITSICLGIISLTLLSGTADSALNCTFVDNRTSYCSESEHNANNNDYDWEVVQGNSAGSLVDPGPEYQRIFRCKEGYNSCATVAVDYYLGDPAALKEFDDHVSCSPSGGSHQ